MRKCNSCGAILPDDSRFCSECGGSDIVSIPEEPVVQQPAPAPQPAPSYPQPDPQPAPQQPSYPAGGNIQPAAPANNGQQGYYQQSAFQPGYGAPAGGAVPPAGGVQQPGAYPYAPQPNYAPAAPVKKKKHTGLIIVIVLGVLLVLLGVIVFIGARIAKKALEEMDPNAYIDELISEFEEGLIVDDTTPAAAYTKGELVGDVYTNEWARLKIRIPDGYANAGADMYTKYSDERTDAAFIVTHGDDDGEYLLLLEDISYISREVTETEYLENITEYWLDEEDVANGWTLSDEYALTIAGRQYKALKMQNDATDYTQMAACRIYDDHVICFLCWSPDGDTTAFLNSITTP